MRFRATISHRLRVLVIVVLAASSGAACDGNYRSPVSPAPAPPPPPPAPDWVAFYTGDAVLQVDTHTDACGEEPPVSAVRGRVWKVIVTGDSIALSEGDGWDASAEYPGTLTGRSFVAKWVVSGQWLGLNCVWREVWVSGTFAEDLSSFDAYQTYVFGPPENQTTTEWRWTARRQE